MQTRGNEYVETHGKCMGQPFVSVTLAKLTTLQPIRRGK